MSTSVTKSKLELDRPLPLSGVAHLMLFSWCQILVYFDRGVVSGVLDYISKEVDGAQSKFQAGLLGGMFMVGFMIAAPFFVRLAQRGRDWTIYSIVIGLGILSLSAVATYFAANNFIALLLVRVVSGAGEAAFCSLAPPIIDDSAPVGRKSLYVGLYFTFLYVGFGIGTGACFLFDSWQSARVLFLVEAAMIVPCIIVFISLRARLSVPAPIKDDPEFSQGHGLVYQLKLVMVRPLFLLFSVGYGLFFFSFGGFAFWVPTVIKHQYPESAGVADLGFGAVTILAGIAGTALGGLLMDYTSRKLSKVDSVRVFGGALISSSFVFLGMLFTFPAILASNVYVFLLFFAIGTTLLFSITAPVNIAIMYSVPTALKGQAMAVSTGLSHLIGDFPSPFVIGALIDATGYRSAMLITSALLVLPAGLWGTAAYVAKRSNPDVNGLPTKPPSERMEQTETSV